MRAIINAGRTTHRFIIRVSTFVEETQQDISATMEIFLDVSGPPSSLEIDIDSEGIDVGGGVWQLQVAALVHDVMLEPVREGIPVRFSLDPDEVATIEHAVTGNRNLRGESTRGVAYTLLTYRSRATFDTLTILATIETEERDLVAERLYILPLQRGVLTLSVSPANWMIDEYPRANFRCVAELRDGHGVLINNAPVIFGSGRGYFLWYDHVRGDYVEFRIHDDPPEPFIKFTGWHISWGQAYARHREQPGQATVFLQGVESDFFLDPVTPEVRVQIDAHIQGYDDVMAEPRIVVVTRHP